MRQLMRDRETKPVELPNRPLFHQRILFGVQIDSGEIRRDRRFHTVFGREIIEWDRIESPVDFKECKNINRRPLLPERFIPSAQFLDF